MRIGLFTQNVQLKVITVVQVAFAKLNGLAAPLLDHSLLEQRRQHWVQCLIDALEQDRLP